MCATSSTRLSPSPNLLQVNEPKRYGSTLSLEEKCEQSFFLFYYYRMEDEAVLDRGASLLKHMCDEEEVEGKTTCPVLFLHCLNVYLLYSSNGLSCCFVTFRQSDPRKQCVNNTITVVI